MNVDPCLVFILDRKGLAQLLERLTAEREVVDSIPGTGQILTVLKLLVNEGTAFALQMAGSSSGNYRSQCSRASVKDTHTTF